MSGPAKIIHVGTVVDSELPGCPNCINVRMYPLYYKHYYISTGTFLSLPIKARGSGAAAFAIRSQCLFWWIDCGALTSQHNLEPYSFLCDQESNCWLSVWLLFPSVLFPLPSKTQYLTDMMFCHIYCVLCTTTPLPAAISIYGSFISVNSGVPFWLCEEESITTEFMQKACRATANTADHLSKHNPDSLL